MQDIAGTGSTVTWVLNNHDQVRTVTRYGEPGTEGSGLGAARARAAALLMLALPGAAYIYQGEELGLPEVVDLPDDVLTDPIFRRTGSRARIRDGCRVPLPWSGHASPFGFTSGAAGAKPWLPQPEWFAEHATDRALADTRSFWHLYRDGLQLRAQPAPVGRGRAALAGHPARRPRLRPRRRPGVRRQLRHGTRCPRRSPAPRCCPAAPARAGVLPGSTAAWWISDCTDP